MSQHGEQELRAKICGFEAALRRIEDQQLEILASLAFFKKLLTSESV